VRRPLSTDRARYAIHRPDHTDAIIPFLLAVIIGIAVFLLPVPACVVLIGYISLITLTWARELQSRAAFFAFLDAHQPGHPREAAFEFTVEPLRTEQP
jgi:hypothetical protein